MSFTGGRNLPDSLVTFQSFGPVSPATAAPRYVNVKDADAVAFVVTILNTTGVTPGAITLTQAKEANGATNAALGYTTYYSNTDPANTSVLTKQTAASNTFTPVNTANAALTYVIPVDPQTLDTANSYTYVRASLANATNAVTSVVALVRPKYAGKANSNPNFAV
jgi:hypothetical protein